MKIRSIDRNAIFGGGEYEKVAVGVNRDVWQHPLCRHSLGIAEGPAGQVYGRRTRVVEFDPIRAVAVFVKESLSIGGKKFIDDDVFQPGDIWIFAKGNFVKVVDAVGISV